MPKQPKQERVFSLLPPSPFVLEEILKRTEPKIATIGFPHNGRSP
jgi:hypothetical protein